MHTYANNESTGKCWTQVWLSCDSYDLWFALICQANWSWMHSLLAVQASQSFYSVLSNRKPEATKWAWSIDDFAQAAQAENEEWQKHVLHRPVSSRGRTSSDENGWWKINERMYWGNLWAKCIGLENPVRDPTLIKNSNPARIFVTSEVQVSWRWLRGKSLKSPRKKRNTVVNFLAGKAHDYNGSLIQSSTCQRGSHQSECIQVPQEGSIIVSLPSLPKALQTAARLRCFADKYVYQFIEVVYQVEQWNAMQLYNTLWTDPYAFHSQLDSQRMQTATFRLIWLKDPAGKGNRVV